MDPGLQRAFVLKENKVQKQNDDKVVELLDIKIVLYVIFINKKDM